ncbi:MAG: protease HtpX [Gammaproteobacteria bacterium]|nr:protease HtpX [Gammaproteobacteria bacterium]NNF59980.1 protease HtpX [Gammaproteobacteria bacterium]NNM21460.1 protease HtpX [Gammaproteobacteria bacterium]
MFKRIFLFGLTNIAVLAVLAVVASLFGVDRRMMDGSGGLNLQALMVFSLIWGMAGSLISLALSKWSAKRMTGAHVIESPRNETEQWLVSTVERQARQAGIGMPDVAIYDSPEVNAFATGARRNSALVAVSAGLLNSMSREEAEAVLGHEISHVANGDMVTLTLLQGVLNAFVIFFSRIAGHVVDSALRGGRSGGGGIGYFAVSMLMQVVLGFLATIIVRWFSRYREFRADAGGAQLAGRDKMIGALRRLGGREAHDLPQQMAAMGISGGMRAGFSRLFSTHPPITERIAHLQQLRH